MTVLSNNPLECDWLIGLTPTIPFLCSIILTTAHQMFIHLDKETWTALNTTNVLN